MNEARIEYQSIPADETPEVAQRSLTTTVIETYVAVKVLDEVVSDVVSDAYGAVKDAAKAGWTKLHRESEAAVTEKGEDQQHPQAEG